MLSANIANYLRGIAALSASSVLSVNSVLEHFGSRTICLHSRVNTPARSHTEEACFARRAAS